MKINSVFAGMFLAGLAVTIGVPSTATAEEREREINPWRHCGIGAAIFPDNPTAAAISNIIWDSGTTAVSSATTTPNACSGEEIRVAMFIDHTYDALVVDLSAGHGEHLLALVNLVGCSTDESTPFVDGMRAGLTSMVAAENYAEMQQSDRAFLLYDLVIDGTESVASCSI